MYETERMSFLTKTIITVTSCSLFLSTMAAAESDPWAPDNLPEFDYPTERNPATYFPSGLPEWKSPPLGNGPFDLQSYEQRDYLGPYHSDTFCMEGMTRLSCAGYSGTNKSIKLRAFMPEPRFSITDRISFAFSAGNQASANSMHSRKR